MNPRFTVCCVLSFLLAFQRTALAQGSLSPPGPPSETMRSLAEIEPRTPISSLPFAITQPGTYYLTGNLTGSAAGITVSAPNVTIDLNGFELAGDRFVFGHGLIVVPSDKVSVQGGVIRDWGGDGVHAPGCSNVVLSALHVARCAGDGIEVGSATLRDVVSENNDGAGVRAGSGMGSGKAVFQDMHFVRARGNGGSGVDIGSSTSVSVRGSDLSGNGGSGLESSATVVYGATVQISVRDCRLDDNAIQGLSLPGVGSVCYDLTVANSSASRNGGRGLDAVNLGTTARGRTLVMALACTSNGDDGVRVAGPCDLSVADSTVSDNAGHGVVWAATAAAQEGRIVLERCAVDHNTGRGLHVEESVLARVACATRGSSFRNNGGDGIAVLLTHADSGLQLDLRDGVSNGNGGNGLNVHEGSAEDNQNVIVDFQFSLNTLAGAAKVDTGYAPSLFSRSTAHGNGGPGLALQGGAWTLQGGSASDNGGDGLQAAMVCCRGHVIIMKIDDMEFARNAGSGLSLQPHSGDAPYQLVLHRVSASGNSGQGVGLIGPAHLSAQGSSMSSNGLNGIHWTKQNATDAFRVSLDRCEANGNTGSGLFVSEPGRTDNDCDFAATTFHGNGGDGVTLLLPDLDSRLDIVHRGGGASDNAGHGLHLAAGRSANQGFFDIALSRNAGSGCNKIDAGASPGTMERVVAQHNGLHGLDLAGGTWSLARCLASDNMGGGFVMSSKHVRTGHVTLMKFDDCDAERNGGDGLSVATVDDDAGYRITCHTSHFRSNAGNGLRLSCDTLLSSVELDWRDSSAADNAANGVQLIAPVAMDKGLRFRMEGGDCDDNDQDGIAVDASVEVRSGLLREVSLRNNTGTGFRAPAGSLRLERCVAEGNGGDGFHVFRPTLPSVADWGDDDCDGLVAMRNGGSGIVFAGFDPLAKTHLSVTGGQASVNAVHGIDLETSPGARGRVHGVHMGDNGVHGLVSSASSLSVTGNQATGNGGAGIHVAAGAHVVARNVCTDNATGVHLAVAGSTVYQNTFGGAGPGGVPQVHVDDLSGASDVAPFQSAATGTSPVGNQVF